MSITTQQQVPTGTWNADPIHSTANFAVKHMGVGTFRAGFKTIEARLADGVLEGRVPVESVSIDQPDLRGHVLAADFLDAATYPEVSFVSRDLRVDGDRLELDGDLTIRGITQPVNATGTIEGPGEDIAGKRRLAISLETIVDRTAHGLTWNAELPKGGKVLGERVTLSVELELVQEA